MRIRWWFRRTAYRRHHRQRRVVRNGPTMSVRARIGSHRDLITWNILVMLAQERPGPISGPLLTDDVTWLLPAARELIPQRRTATGRGGADERALLAANQGTQARSCSSRRADDQRAFGHRSLGR